MNLIRHFNDCVGLKFDVGDTVGVVFETYGHSGRIRIGTVSSLDSKTDKVVVSWNDTKKESKPLTYRKERFVLLRRK